MRPRRARLDILGGDSIAAQRILDAESDRRRAPDECEVFLAHQPIVKLRRQRAVGAIVFCDDHDSGCPAVQAVHDAGAFHAADPRQIVHVMQERIHQRAGRMSRRGVHHHSGGFIDDDQIGIVVNDRQRQIFRARCGRVAEDVHIHDQVRRDGQAGLDVAR